MKVTIKAGALVHEYWQTKFGEDGKESDSNSVRATQSGEDGMKSPKHSSGEPTKTEDMAVSLIEESQL